MDSTSTVDRQPAAAKRSSAKADRSRPTVVTHAFGLLFATAIALAPMPAKAVDGCLVLLCLAAPSWRSIAQCVPPVQKVFRDLSKGRPFPSCGMSGAGNTANHSWSRAPAFCPPQYTRTLGSESAPIYQYCDYRGAISVSINGAPFSRTWWSFGGDSVTEFSPAAKAQLGSWDTRFDEDYAKWLAALPPPQAGLP